MQINRELIKRRRKELRLTQAQLGKLVNHDQAMVHCIEAGKYNLDSTRLSLYAKALELPEQALVIFEN